VTLSFSLRLSFGTLLVAISASAGTATHLRLYSIEELKKTVQIARPSFSADGSRLLFSSNESGLWNVRSLSVRGGKSVPMTASRDDGNFAISYFPHDGRFLYSRDHAGDENQHLIVCDTSGRSVDVTPGAGVRAVFKGWDGTGDGFFFTSNARDEKFFDLYRLDAKTLAPALVYRNDGGYEIGRVSPDGRWIALTKSTADGDDLFVRDPESGDVRRVSTGGGSSEAQGFDAQSRYLYFITDERSEFGRLVRYDLRGGAREDVEAPSAEMAFSVFSADGLHRATGIATNGRTNIEITDTATGARISVPGLSAGSISTAVFSRDGRKLAFSADDDRSPSNIYVFDLTTRTLKRLTDTLNPAVDANDLVTGTDVRFRSFDGMSIPAILFRPHGATASKKSPAVIWVHGGPGGQYTHGYFSIIQYLVNHGYTVLGVNNRGSSGYGKTFAAADDKRHGREPLWDCVEAKRYLASLPFVDGERVAIAGESYGGYMALAALAFQPAVFRAGVDFYGVANWVRTLESIPPYWESERRRLYAEIGDPVKDRAMLESISPLFHAGAIERPLLVVQGANDRRTLRAESDQIVEALRKRGVPVTYLLFEGEGHGLTKVQDQIEAFRGTLECLDRFVKAPTR
jgi:dipeptidyl aminopeptidase/acylaminoacyl peptidase